MPDPFLALSPAQFQDLLKRFPFSRKVDAIHLHQTGSPGHAGYRGLQSMREMTWPAAGHVVIAPDGTIWTGRNWNTPPSSAPGHNGNEAYGPFMIELIGDFETGKDSFADPQRKNTIAVSGAVQKLFSLMPETLRFHRHMADQACPGEGIDYEALLDDLRARQTPDSAPAAAADKPFGDVYRDDGLTGSDRAVIETALDSLLKATPPDHPRDDERDHSSDRVIATSGPSVSSEAARGVDITTSDLLALRPHVINLRQGMLAPGGIFSTAREDVQRLFGEDMEKAFADPASAGMPARDGQPFRVMIWAHGGLINEKQGLGIAKKHLEFWKKNGIYPVYFVWETGLLQTVGQLLRGILPGGGGARNIFSDNVSDPALERTARAAGGEKIWSGMKRNAEIASSPKGGATFAAAELKKFCDKHAGQIEIYAGGHSAGSIFHAHFLPAAFAAGMPALKQLFFLAPAVRVDTFENKLAALVGNKIGRLGLYTMFKEQELDDNCAAVYRKSLLYLIRFSLEKEQNAEILGLEECLRRDPEVARLFGLGGSPKGNAEAHFSPSPPTQSTTHGGFDDDPATMDNVAMRILNATKLKMPYPRSRAAGGDPWVVEEVEQLRGELGAVASPSLLAPVDLQDANTLSPSEVSRPGVIRGRRRALCVGIDRYTIRPLAGCVADAKLWASTLRNLGFECETLLDEQATYSSIKSKVASLIRNARAGDVIVWQYAGHGTQVPDASGDERDGDSPVEDEAICPADMHMGRLLIDDEIGAMIDRLAPGVNFTMFIDCCHSGRINRFGLGQPQGGGTARDERPRFVVLPPEIKEAYLRFAREESAASRGFDRSRSRGEAKSTNEVLFSACLSTEVAWESNGQGEFTLRATNLLRQKGARMNHEEFMKSVVAAFGPDPRQTPNLTCASTLRKNTLLQALGAASAPQRAAPEEEVAAAAGQYSGVAEALDTLARELRKL